MQAANLVKKAPTLSHSILTKTHRGDSGASIVNKHQALPYDEQVENATRVGHNLEAISVLPPDPLVQPKRATGVVSRLTAFNSPSQGNATAITRLPASWLVRPSIQARLTVGKPNDAYEQEADCAADQVMPMAEPRVQTKCACGGEAGPNGECAACKAKRLEAQAQVQTKSNEEEDVVQTKSDTSPPDATPDLESRLNSSRGSGAALPDETRSSMESAFGVDFSGVRVHTGGDAVQMNRELSAQAFTHGSDIYFNSGKYDPGSEPGKGLLAHELTHVVQQRGNLSLKIQRRSCVNNPATAPSSGMTGCATENSRPSHANGEASFASGTTLNTAAKSSLSSLAAQWHASGRNDVVRIDGFSGCDGDTALNWRLSCNRAKAIEAELKAPSDGTPGIPPSAAFTKIAHGETDEFSTTAVAENRKGLVTLQPVPTAVPRAIPATGATDFQISRIPRSSQDQVFFANGSAVLTADAITQLGNLKSAAPGSVRLVGFASMEEPAPLAQDRANAVRTLLTAAPNAVTVTSTAGNAAATATRSDFARARSVEILVGAAAPSTLDCDAIVPGSVPPVKVNPPTASCATMDPATGTAFTAALVTANNAMTQAMNVINPAHADHNPALIRRFFGNSDPSTLTTLAANMGRLQTHVSALPASTQCGGQCDTGGCEGGNAIAYNNDVDAASTMTLCVPNFRSLNQNDQARNLIHESAHGTTPLGGAGAPTEGTKDVAYRHERMMFQLSPADRLRNSDSYALFALFAREVKTTGNPSATPSGISVPSSDTITGITGSDRSALEMAIAQLEKRLSWASDHTNQLFGQAQRVRSGAIAWSASWAEAHMREASTRFPLTAPPATPNLADMAKLAAIVERYKIMKSEVKRDLTISAMPSGVVSWPATGGFASNTLRVGPDFFRASPDSQVSLLLENLARSTPNIETAFVPAYVAFAKWIHERAA